MWGVKEWGCCDDCCSTIGLILFVYLTFGGTTIVNCDSKNAFVKTENDILNIYIDENPYSLNRQKFHHRLNGSQSAETIAITTTTESLNLHQSLSTDNNSFSQPLCKCQTTTKNGFTSHVQCSICPENRELILFQHRNDDNLLTELNYLNKNHNDNDDGDVVGHNYATLRGIHYKKKRIRRRDTNDSGNEKRNATAIFTPSTTAATPILQHPAPQPQSGIVTAATTAKSSIPSGMSMHPDNDEVQVVLPTPNTRDAIPENGIINNISSSIIENTTCTEPSCINHTIVCVGEPDYCNYTYEEYVEMLYDYIYPTVPEWILIFSHAVVFFMGLVSCIIKFLKVFLFVFQFIYSQG